MIGASNSPMNMFTGGGNEAFQRGMMIGNANSPFSTVADALKNVVDRYHSQLAMQQDQANKIDLLKQEYALKRANATPDPDVNGPQIIKDPTTGKFFYGNRTVDPTSGQMKVGWTPVTNSPPTDEKKIFENSLYEKINAGMNGGTPSEPPIPGIPAAPAMSAPAVPSVNSAPVAARPLDANTARALLQQAGGDKNKARAIAQQQGYSF